MVDPDRAEYHGVDLAWDPATRLVTVRFGSWEHPFGSDEAAWLVARTVQWAGEDQPYGFLVDCAGLENPSVGWRATLNDYFRHVPRGRVLVAWYNLSVVIRIATEMFALATRAIEGKTFKSEATARAWLRERGIG